MNYQEQAKQLRRTVLKMTHSAASSHIGSNFSCADIMTVLYDIADFSLLPNGTTKDVIIVKSWSAANVYACLVAKGLLPQEAVDNYGKEGTQWTTILEPIKPYIPVGTGAMGYHLPFAVGMALAKKLKGEEGIVYCLISDGELDIGSTWESTLIAAHHNLDNLVLVVDKNGWQAMDSVKNVLNTDSIEKKFEAFGWEWNSVDGHDCDYMAKAFKNRLGKPIVHIATTTKGKGVSFMENDNIWHYQHVNEETLGKALEELK